MLLLEQARNNVAISLILIAIIVGLIVWLNIWYRKDLAKMTTKERAEYKASIRIPGDW
jgi:hypothetical protein